MIELTCLQKVTDPRQPSITRSLSSSSVKQAHPTQKSKVPPPSHASDEDEDEDEEEAVFNAPAQKMVVDTEDDEDEDRDDDALPSTTTEKRNASESQGLFCLLC